MWTRRKTLMSRRRNLAAAALATAILLLAGFAQAGQVKVPKGYDQPCGFRNYYAEREKPAPLLDHPLRHPSITRGPDGVYYLTGTAGMESLKEPGAIDFDNSPHIMVWKSQDLENWTPLGTVFDIAAWSGREKLDMPWWRYPTVKPGLAFGPLVRGIHAPEIHYLKDNFWIVFSINGQGVGLLKSTSGKAEGPYTLLSPSSLNRHGASVVRPLIHEGGSPSLFQDDDGKIYLLWGRGLIAPLNEDMTAIAEAPRQLLCQTDGQIPDFPRTVGQRGFHLFKADGKYRLTAENISYRDQYAASDVFVASSDSLFGPYGQRRWMIPHAGETTVFKGPDGALYASYCGNDEESAFVDRAGIVPLKWDTEKPEQSRVESKFPRIAAGVHTERGAWHELLPVTPYGMRDVTCILAPDGFFYYSGSNTDSHFAGRLAVFRSKDLVNWEEITVMKLDDLPWLSKESVAARKKSSAAKKGGGLDDKFMDCEVHFIKGTFYFIYALYEMKSAALAPASDGKAHHGVRYMRSVSGKIEGPWEDMGMLGASQGSFFEDNDGQVYVCAGRFGLGKMRADMSGGRDGDLRQVLPADGSHAFTDVGAYLRKINGKYAYFSCGYANGWWHESPPPLGDDGISSYNFSYMVAAEPFGPYGRARMAVDYGGHGGIFQDAQGRWWAAFFGCEGARDFRRHWWCPPGVVPLEVFEKNGELIIRVAAELPPDFKAALDKKRAELKTEP